MYGKIHFPVRAAVFVGILLTAALSASAQTTLFNIPTTDTLSRGSLFIEADLITKPVCYRHGGYQTYGYRVVYGVDNKTEAGANFYYTRDGGDAVGEVQFNAKRKIYNSEKRGVAVSGGTLVYLPLKSSRGDKPAVMVYANVSKTLEPLNGLRVTAGVYSVFGGGTDYGTKTGVILGVEQPITKKFSFLADWYSGQNRLGYSAAGLNYNITKRQFILAGYNFGNSGRGNNAFSAFYGYTF